ncbi:hypothetical protein [Deinococcus altitudinis]|uniref:hypothetical protein n=1 Tax=Deinococcus altitudinis TaxID=468914 RepID=UPI003892A187
MKADQPLLKTQDFKVGEIVMCWDMRSEVIWVSSRNVQVKILDGGAAGMTVLAAPEKLKKVD